MRCSPNEVSDRSPGIYLLLLGGEHPQKMQARVKGLTNKGAISVAKANDRSIKEQTHTRPLINTRLRLRKPDEVSTLRVCSKQRMSP